MVTFIETNAKYRAYVTISLQDATTFALEFGGFIIHDNEYYIVFLIDGLRFTDNEKAKLYNFVMMNFNFHLN